VTPLQVDQFALELQHHPDLQLVNYVLDGISNGFRVGFSLSHKLKSAKKNKPSALQHAAVVDEYLAHEVSLGRVAGPFTSPPLPNLQVSSFRVIPKRGQPGKWRLIVDLSSPGGASVNGGINPDEFSLHYITVDKVIRLVSQFGRGALMAKFDVESAYRNVPIHPLDRYLLGMKWRHHFYVDLALQFGLRSAPYIFNSIADLVEWILMRNHQIPDLLHYLDDFITAGPPDSPQCARNLTVTLAICDRLGLPLHPGKCVGPSSVLTVLGIELDSDLQMARLPEDKLQALQGLVHSWLPRKWCFRQELESLIGHLHHAAKVVWPGRTFFRRMIDLLCCFRRKDHPIHLNNQFDLDLQWWHKFLSEWHGVSFWLFPGLSPEADIALSSDAAGSLGYGAFLRGLWFTGSWSPSQAQQSIAYKELFPVVVAAHIWGDMWCRRHVLFHSDNDAVVHVLNSRTSKIPCIMHLLLHLLLSAARHSFSFSSQHVPGVNNQVADALSHFHWQRFWQLAPDAQRFPTPVPPKLLEELTSPL